eukprot:TRINITY_DN22436_c0_g1_i1.p1 TRINITY_DN22436_c0_g1~~TRINITY_DN22436_c0_g1_i1.p1  ORF type:complete len:650 (+),score=184.54 TRINITY_DN22436_c0_g1_i1:72-2021(+)
MGGDGGETSKINKRATWLNANVFADNPIDREAIGCMLELGISRAFELFKEVEEKADKIGNPSGYLITAFKREGGAMVAAPAPVGNKGGGRGGSDAEYSKIRKRITWLNANVFQDKPLEPDAIEFVASVGIGRAFELLKDLEEKGSEIRNPSSWVIGAVKRESAPPSVGIAAQQGKGRGGQIASEEEYSKLRKRVTWLNANVLQEKTIDGEAIDSLSCLGIGRCFELLKDLEEKADEINKPSSWLKAAVQREAPPPTQHGPPPIEYGKGGGKGGWSDQDYSTLHRRTTWLNANVFQEKPPIDEEAVESMVFVGVGRALELLKDMEEKAPQINNPCGWIKNALKREGVAPANAPPTPRGGGGKGASVFVSDQEYGTIHRRVTWLNANVLQDKPPVDGEAIDALLHLGVGRALELLKDVEAKSADINNPSSWLKAAVSREAGGAAHQAPAVVESRKGGGRANNNASGEERKIHQRANWLSANVFPDRPIDDEAIGAMFGMGIARAFELFKDIEEKADQMRNPSGYLKAAASREGLGPPQAQGKGAPPAQSQGTGKGSSDYDKIHRKVTWMNGNVFQASPIDHETIDALANVGADRALDMLKDLVNKGEEVKNPSNYLKAAVKREFGGGARGVKRTATGSIGGPPSKKGGGRQ